MVIEIPQPWIAQPDSHDAVDGFALHEASGSPWGTVRFKWRDGCVVHLLLLFPPRPY